MSHESNNIRYGVIPDIHGQSERLYHAFEQLDSIVDMYVILGDVINGPDTRNTIALIRSLGEKAITIAANHEWVCRNALSTENSPETTIWRKQIWPFYEDRMLESYCVKQTGDWNYNAQQLREVLQSNGDLEWLNSLPPYFETDTFIALHAGPRLDTAWQEQADYLDTASSMGRRTFEEPEQLFSRHLAEISDIPESVDERIFVTGHTNPMIPIDQRIGQRRVRLSSNLEIGDPLYIWHSNNGIITQH